MKRATPPLPLSIWGPFSIVLSFFVSPGFAAPSINLSDRNIIVFENAPPIPAPVRITLNSREKVRIILKVRGLQRESVTFTLRSEAEFGKAKLLPQVSLEWAEIEYTPPQDPRFTTDTFKFAVSNSKGTSSDSIAEIAIRDVGPRLETQRKLDFGVLQTGGSQTRRLEIRNTGDVVAQGTLAVTGEWLVAGGSYTYSIQPGQSSAFEIFIAPKSTGTLEGEIKFSTASTQSVLLMAKVEDWVHAKPDPLFLRIQKSGERSAKLTLTNETEQRQWVQLESEHQLTHPYAVWLEPKQTTQISVTSTTTIPSEELGKLILSGTQDQQRLMLWRTATFGPSLGGIKNGSALLLKPRSDKRQDARLVLWNQGGRAGRWSIQASTPYESSVNTVDLKPGESTEIQVSLPHKTTAKQDFISKGPLYNAASPTAKPLVEKDGSLEIQLVRPAMLDATQAYSLRLTTKTSAPEPKETTPPQALIKKTSPHPSATTSTALPDTPSFSVLNLPEAPQTKPPFSGLDPEVVKAILERARPGTESGIEIRKVTAHSVRVAFLPAPLRLNHADLQVSTLVIDDTEGNFGQVWKPVAKKRTKVEFTNINVKKDGKDAKVPLEYIIVDIEGLPSNSLNMIRIAHPLSLDGDALFVRRCDVQTLPEPHWLSPSRPYLWTLGSLIALSSYISFRRRRF